MSESWKTVEELLAVPERWTQRIGARAANGNPVNVGDSRAVCWCVDVALDLIYPAQPQRSSACIRLLNAIGAKGRIELVRWNDSIYHATMIAAVRKAGV